MFMFEFIYLRNNSYLSSWHKKISKKISKKTMIDYKKSQKKDFQPSPTPNPQPPKNIQKTPKIQINPHLSSFSFFLPILAPLFCSASLIASSKTSFNPYWVNALHYKYFALCYSSIICLATSFLMGAFLGSFTFSRY